MRFEWRSGRPAVCHALSLSRTDDHLVISLSHDKVDLSSSIIGLLHLGSRLTSLAAPPSEANGFTPEPWLSSFEARPAGAYKSFPPLTPHFRSLDLLVAVRFRPREPTASAMAIGRTFLLRMNFLERIELWGSRRNHDVILIRFFAIRCSTRRPT